MNSKTNNTVFSLHIAQLILNYNLEFLIITCLLYLIEIGLPIQIISLTLKWLILVGEFNE